ncbi:hypothetical protein DFJ73DRAFT_955828 [Zopfochytrium polystomum]|nr:hypothetical protein DFJ73DRAFT_955828 [Zopfochytrium polystomum]
MVSQRHRLLSKNVEEEEYRNQLKEKNAEINKFLGEIKALSKQNSELAADVESIGQELEATLAEVDRNVKEVESAKQIITNSDSIIDELTEERDLLKIKLEELSDQLHFRAERNEHELSGLKDDLFHYKKLAKEAEAALSGSKRKIDDLNEQVKTLKAERDRFNEDAMQKELTEKDELIVSLQEKLEESYKDFELLSLDWDRVDSLVKAKSGGEVETLRSQAALAEKLQDKIKVMKENHAANTAKMRGLETQLEGKEKELVSLRQRNRDYEAGVYGLKDSIRETKQMKLEKNLRDKEIAALNRRMNEYEDQLSEVVHENEELRERLGLEDERVETSHIKTKHSVELEQARSLNETLRKEVDILEQERIKLKDELRKQALFRGERAVAMGLPVEDLVAVEEYAAKLRIGEALQADRDARLGRPVISNAQLEKLAIELERVHVEAAEAREKIERTEAEHRRLQDENRALEAVIKELSATLIKTRGTTAKGDSSGQDPPSFPVITKLLRAMERKRQNDVSRDISTNENVEDNLLEVNQSLREELASANSRLEELEAEIELTHIQAEKSRKDAEALRLRAAKARGKVLELPAELLLGSVHDYSAVVEQLVECLLELQVKDKELKESREALEKFNHFYATTAAKHRLLYKDHHIYRKQAEEEINRYKAEAREAVEAKLAAEIKAEEAQKALQSLSSGSHQDLRNALCDSQRNVAVLRVNEATLKRRHMALAEVEALCRKENARLQSDFMQLERTSREAICELNRAKRKLKAKIDDLLRDLAESVPYRDYTNLRNSLELYRAKTRYLLEKEQDWVQEKIRCESDAKELQAAKETINNLQSSVIEAEKTIRSMEVKHEQVIKLKAFDPIKEKLSEAYNRIGKLEVSEEMLQRRAELASDKCAALEQNEAKLKARLDSLEKKYMEATEENIRLREIEADLRNEFEGGVSGKEYAKVSAKLAEMSDRIVELEEDIAKYKDLADIAATQSTDLLHLHSCDEKEKAILRATVQELQMEGDERLLIGKLHHHILALQMSEAVALRKLESASLKCSRVETQLAAAEKSMLDFDEAVYQLRTDNRQSVRLLYQTVSELRLRVAGSVMLEKHETKSSSRTNSSEANRTWLTALKNPSAAMERIASWQGRMATLQIENMRLTRKLDSLTRENANLEHTLEDQVNRTMVLEEDLVELQRECDLKQIEWEKRQMNLELGIQQLQQERDEIVRAASTAELQSQMPDKAKPISHQLESALQLLIQRSRLLSAQEHMIATLEAQVSKLTKQIQDNSEKLSGKESHIMELKSKVLKHELKPGLGLSEDDKIARTMARAREEDAMNAAQEIIKSLQRQLAKKDHLVERYRKMITDIRKEVAEREEAESREVCSLTEVINTLNDKQIERLRNPYEVPHQLVANRDGEPDPDTVQELERIIRVKEDEAKGLHKRLSLLDESYKDFRANSEREIRGLKERLESKDAELEERATEIQQLQKALKMGEEELRNAATMAAETLRARGLQEMVGKLRRELEKREAKVASLTKALEEMKEAMLRTAEDAAISKIKQSRGATKIAESEAKRAAKAEGDLAKLRDELLRKDKDLQKLSDNLRDSQERAEDLQLKLKKAAQGLKEKSQISTAPKGESQVPLAVVEEERKKVAELTKEKWDTEKACQKRIEVVKKKLEEKTKQLEECTRKETTLREAVANSERERKKLQQRNAALMEMPPAALALRRQQEREHSSSNLPELPGRATGKAPQFDSTTSINTVSSAATDTPTEDSLQAMLEDPDATPLEAKLIRQLKRSIADRDEVQRERYELEREVEEWRQLANVEQANEIEHLRLRCKQLKEELEDVKKRPARSKDGAEVTFDLTARKGDKSKGLTAVLESRVTDLLERLHLNENELAKVEAKLVEAIAEREAAEVGAKRIARRANELEEALRDYREMEEARNAKLAENMIPGLNVTIGQLRASTSKLLSDKSPAELASLVDHLSSFLEQLKNENAALKKSGGISNAKYMDMVHEIKQLRKDKADAVALVKARATADAQLAKVENENAKLRRQLRKEADKLDGNVQRAKELEVVNERLTSEVSKLRRALAGLSEDTGSGRASPSTVKEVRFSDEAKEDNQSRRFTESDEIEYLRAQLAERDKFIDEVMDTQQNSSHRLEDNRLRRELEIWRARALQASSSSPRSSYRVEGKGKGRATPGDSDVE